MGTNHWYNHYVDWKTEKGLVKVFGFIKSLKKIVDLSSLQRYMEAKKNSKEKWKYAYYDEVKTRLCWGWFVVAVVDIVVVVLIVVAIHKGLVVVDKSLSDTH